MVSTEPPRTSVAASAAAVVRLCARRPGLPVLAVLYLVALCLADSAASVILGVVVLAIFAVRLAMVVRTHEPPAR